MRRLIFALLAASALVVSGAEAVRPAGDASARKTVLLLGDSIRLGYCRHVREMMKGTADVYFPENENGMFAYYTLRRIWDWTKLVPDPQSVDVIHFNNGLWDLGQRDGRECLTPIDVYASTMSRIADELRHFFPRAKLVFATTTPINERVFNEQHLKGNAEVARYNAAALKALGSKIDAVDDLNRFVRENGLAAHQVDIVHYDEAGYRLLAGEVVRVVSALLK